MDDRTYLLYISECLADIDEFVAGGHAAFMASKLVQAAVLYKLQTLAESTQLVSEATKATHPEIDWAAIRGFRNRLVHGYLSVNLNIVWNIVVNDLPPLKQAIVALLSDTERGDAQAD